MEKPKRLHREVLEAILAMLPVASTDFSRPHLAGVHVVAKGDSKTQLSATDGHMLARRVLEHPFPFDGEFTVKRAEAEGALTVLVERAGTFVPTFLVPERGVLVGEHVSVLFAEFKDTFPKFEDVLPKFSGPTVAIALNVDFLSAVAAAITQGATRRHIRITFDPTVSWSPFLVESMVDGSGDPVGAVMPVRCDRVNALAKEMAARIKGGAS